MYKYNILDFLECKLSEQILDVLYAAVLWSSLVYLFVYQPVSTYSCTSMIQCNFTSIDDDRC